MIKKGSLNSSIRIWELSLRLRLRWILTCLFRFSFLSPICSTMVLTLSQTRWFSRMNTDKVNTAQIPQWLVKSVLIRSGLPSNSPTTVSNSKPKASTISISGLTTVCSGLTATSLLEWLKKLVFFIASLAVLQTFPKSRVVIRSPSITLFSSPRSRTVGMVKPFPVRRKILPLSRNL